MFSRRPIHPQPQNAVPAPDPNAHDINSHVQPAKMIMPTVPSPEANPRLFTYAGISMYQSDLAAIQKNEWYTDNIIHYTITHIFAGMPTLISSEKIVFLSGTETEWMRRSRRESGFKLEDIIDIRGFNYVFAVLNDWVVLDAQEDAAKLGKATTVDAGTHWTLVFIDVKQREMHHFDYHPANPKTLQRLCYHTTIVDFSLRLDSRARLGNRSSMLLSIMPRAAPSNTSGADCGVIVCWLVKELLVRIRDKGRLYRLNTHIDCLERFDVRRERETLALQIEVDTRMLNSNGSGNLVNGVWHIVPSPPLPELSSGSSPSSLPQSSSTGSNITSSTHDYDADVDEAMRNSDDYGHNPDALQDQPSVPDAMPNLYNYGHNPGAGQDQPNVHQGMRVWYDYGQNSGAGQAQPNVHDAMPKSDNYGHNFGARQDQPNVHDAMPNSYNYGQDSRAGQNQNQLGSATCVETPIWAPLAQYPLITPSLPSWARWTRPPPVPSASSLFRAPTGNTYSYNGWNVDVEMDVNGPGYDANAGITRNWTG